MGPVVSSLLLSACLVAVSAAQYCQLESNCRKISGHVSSNSYVCQRPSVTFSSLPPQFIAEPSNQLAETGRTDRYITFECAVTYVSGYQPHFTWEHNGREIENNLIFNEGGSSTLRVQSTKSAEGAYRCIVNSEQLKYSMTSRYGYLQIEDCSDNGWIDTLLPSTYSNENTIDLPIAKGATTILECTPNTTLSSPFTIWLRNNNATLDANYIKLPNGGLLVRDFDPPAEGVVTFRCIVISSSCSQMTREFNLRMSDGEAHPIAPNNQTAVLGSSVSLYCITNNKASNTWYKDGLLLGSEFNWTVYGHNNEVLVLSNITVEAKGEYSCVYSASSTMTAQLIVLSPPTSATIQVSGHTPHSLSLILSPSANHTLSLACTSDHLSQRTEMTFAWFFRGNPITGSAYTVGVVFQQTGPLLSVTGSGVFGSYQCLATNRGGSAAAVLFVYEDKPNPPSSVSIVRDAYLNVSRPTTAYLYSITINPPHSQIAFEGLAYTLEAYIYRPGDGFYRYCSCNYSAVSGSLGVEVVNFRADAFVNPVKQNLYVRAAIVSSTGGESDYQPYYAGSECGTAIDLLVPPRPANLVQVPSRAEGGWSLTLTWTGPSNDKYPSRLYRTNVTLQCEGSETQSSWVSSIVHSYKVSNTLPGCTTCNWTVSFIILDLTKSSNTIGRFTTSAISPTQAPTLNSVERDNSNGQFVIDFTLPPRKVSCGETYYIVGYSGHKTASQLLAGCNLITGPSAGTAGRYHCDVDLGGVFCWQTLNVSVMFGNDQGMSDESSPMVLPGVTADDLPNFSTLSVTNVTPNEITVSLQVNNTLQCLLNNNPYTVNVCISPPPTNSQPCYSDSHMPHTFTGLNGGTQYFFEGHLSILNVENVSLKSVQQTTRVGVPTSPPRNLTIYPIEESGVSKLLVSWIAPGKNSFNGEITHYKVSISASSGQNVQSNVTEHRYTLEDYVPTGGIWYDVSVSTCTVAGCGPAATGHFRTTDQSQGTLGTWTIVGVAAGSAVLVLLVLTVICVTLCVYFVKKHRKKEDYKQLDRRDLLYNSNEELTDEDLVSVGGPDGAPSIHSDHTQLDDVGSWVKKARMMGYLKSVEQGDAPSEEDCGPTDLTCGSLQSVETLVDIHPDLTEDISSNHQALETASCGQNGTSSPCKSKSHRQRTRNKKEGSMILIQSEQKCEDPSVSHDNSQESILQKRESRFGAEHLQTSPLDAVANLSKNKSTSGQDAISMHSLTNDGVLENHISDDEILQHLSTARYEATSADKPLDVPTHPIATTSYDSVSSNSGYVKNNLQHSYQMEPIDGEDNCSTHLDMSQQFASTTLGSGYVDNKKTYKLPSEVPECNRYVQESGLNNTSSNSDASLPHRSLSQASSYATDLPETLSQDNSVFDESISHTRFASETNGAHPRSTVSSGVYSTSSTSESIKNGSGYVLESDYSSNTTYRSSSEGYASAEATPASPNKQFTLDDPQLSLDREQPLEEAQVTISTSKKLLSHPPVASTQQQTTADTGISVPFEPATDSLKGYLNTRDLNLGRIYITMDQETMASASKPF